MTGADCFLVARLLSREGARQKVAEGPDQETYRDVAVL
jgi:hypothetical protein